MNTKYTDLLDMNDDIEQKEGFQDFLDNAKPAINELVWRFLPGDTTLNEADRLAMDIYLIINNKWNMDLG